MAAPNPEAPAARRLGPAAGRHRRYPSYRATMPRDDFARLERRWREQPLFLPRRRRLPLWPVVVALLVLAGGLGSVLLDSKQMEALIAGLEEAFHADVNPSAAPAGRTAGPAAGERLGPPGDR